MFLRMVSPISPKSCNNLWEPSSHKPFTQACPSSSLSSMHAKRPSFFEMIQGFFSCIFNGLKCLFCCFAKKAPEVTSPRSTAPDISPQKLDSNDPFADKVFAFGANGEWSFQKKYAYVLYTELFGVLGTNGPWHWLKNRTRLEEIEQILLDPKIGLHPLEILYFLFHNEEKISKIVHFKTVVENSPVINYILWMIGRDNPWEDFISKQLVRFKAQEGTIAEMVTGYCAALDLDEGKINPMVQKKQWRKLLLYSFETQVARFMDHTPE